MKISLKLMTCHFVRDVSLSATFWIAHILVSEVLEQLQLSVRSLGEDGGAEGLHDLFDGHRLAGELILRRTATKSILTLRLLAAVHIPDEPEGAHAYRL